LFNEKVDAIALDNEDWYTISIIDHNKLKAMKFLKLVLIKISLKKNSILAHKIYLKL
jgi:hypothetical protein